MFPELFKIPMLNIPLNTYGLLLVAAFTVGLRVSVIAESGTRTEVNSTPLANGAATASVNLPNGVSVVTATISLSVQLALGRPLFINGEWVDRMEVAASFGRNSELIFITQWGRRVRSSEL